MKLYTKEMFLIAAEKCEVSMIDAQHVMRYIDQYVTPIELPSDEEVGKGRDEHIPINEIDMWSERLYFTIGAKWMLHKIQIRAKLNQTNQ